MNDLKTTYIGLSLKNPLVASASPLSKKLDSVRKLEDAGAAAIVLYSLFEEQIRQESLQLDHILNRGTESYPEALTYFPELETYNMGPEKYLTHLQKIKAAVDIPVIASLNGSSPGGWLDYASKIEEAGADALELNIYHLATDPYLNSAELEQNQIDLVKQLKKKLHIPLAVKLSPHYSAFANFAQRMAEAGADGLVLFNRFYQPDLDIETLEVVPNLDLSRSTELRLPLRWVAILHERIETDFAITSGVHTREDVVKALMVGANVVMLASALLQNGISHLAELLKGLEDWMETYQYPSVSQMRGAMSQQAVAQPEAYERANYFKVLNSLDNRLP